MAKRNELVVGYGLFKRIVFFCISTPFLYFGGSSVQSATLEQQIFGSVLLLIGLAIAGINNRLVVDKDAKTVTNTFYTLFPVKRKQQTFITAKSIEVQDIKLRHDYAVMKHGTFPVIIRSPDSEIVVVQPKSYLKAKAFARQLAMFLSLQLEDEIANQVRQVHELDMSFLMLKKSRREKPALPEPYEFTTISRETKDGETRIRLPTRGKYVQNHIEVNLIMATVFSSMLLLTEGIAGLYTTNQPLWGQLLGLAAIPVIYVCMFALVEPAKWEHRQLVLDGRFLKHHAWTWHIRRTQKIPINELYDLTINDLDVIAASDKETILIDGLGSFEDASFIVEDIFYRISKMNS